MSAHALHDLSRGWESVPGWLSTEEATVMQAAVRSTTGAIVELGTWCGRSLLCMAAARAGSYDPDRPIISVDLYPEGSQAAEAAIDGQKITPREAKALARSFVERFGVKRIWQFYFDAANAPLMFTDPDLFLSEHAQRSEEGGTFSSRLVSERKRLEVLKAVMGEEKVGLLYVDDDHEGGRVICEIENWLPHLSERCEILFHDYYYGPYGISEAVQKWMHEHREWYFVEAATGLARFRRDRIPKSCPPSQMRTGTGGPHIQRAGAHGVDRPRLSILYPTWRIGGLDCLKHTLSRQRWAPENYEVILVDALWHYRRDIVAAYFANAPYRVVHVEPIGNVFPADAGNKARNTALAHAKGDVVLWWCDYTVGDHLNASLERHYEMVRRDGGWVVSAGTHLYLEVMPEALNPDFRAALPFDSVDHYVAFLNGLHADSPLWISTFAKPPGELGRERLIVTQAGFAKPYGSGRLEFGTEEFIPLAGLDPKLIRQNGPSDPEVFHAKNEACARKVMEVVNGWDESFDRGHCWDDSDIASRVNALGVPFVIDKGNEVLVANMRPYFPLLKQNRSIRENLAIYVGANAEGSYRAKQGLQEAAA